MHLKGSSWTSDSPVSELGSDRCMSTSTASVENIGERPRDEACDVSWRGWVKGLHILSFAGLRSQHNFMKLYQLHTTSPDSAVLCFGLGHEAKLPRLVSARVPAFITFIQEP